MALTCMFSSCASSALTVVDGAGAVGTAGGAVDGGSSAAAGSAPATAWPSVASPSAGSLLEPPAPCYTNTYRVKVCFSGVGLGGQKSRFISTAGKQISS